jgi:hypothetical protein
MSTTANSRSENVRVFPVVIPELELGHIERHVFAADLVERADHAALEDRPKAFNRVGVDCTDDVLALSVVDDAKRVVLGKVLVASPLVRAEQAHLVRNNFVDEAGESRGPDVFDDAADGIALATDSANDGDFARANTARSAASAALIPMSVLGEPAHEGLVNFNNPAKLLDGLIRESGPDAMCHVPSGLERAETHVAPNLAGTDALLAGQHQVDDAEPVAQRLIRVFKDRAGNVREAIAGLRSALVALPVPRITLQLSGVLSAAARAADALRPAFADKIGATGVLIGKHRLELADGHLMNLLGLLCSGHGCRSFVVRRNMPCPS